MRCGEPTGPVAGPSALTWNKEGAQTVGGDMSGSRSSLVPWLLGLIVVAGGVVLLVGNDTTAPEQVADPFTTFDPVEAGAALPDGYRIGLARDQIAPVYEPVFTAADAVDWPADSLVIGVAGDNEAKAYPVTHLNSREMVIDSLEGIPILVTW